MLGEINLADACADCPPLEGIDPNDRRSCLMLLAHLSVRPTDRIAQCIAYDSSRRAADIAILPRTGPQSVIFPITNAEKLAEITERIAACTGPAGALCVAGLYRYMPATGTPDKEYETAMSYPYPVPTYQLAEDLELP